MKAQTVPKKKIGTFRFSHGQNAVYDADDKRILLACAGEQGGKSILGAFWMRKQIKKFGAHRNYVIGAPTYKVMEQSSRPTMMKLLSGAHGTYQHQNAQFKLHEGGNIFFRSSTDPDSVIGIPDCAAAWIDEGGKVSRMFFVSIQGRVARLRGPILITTTPYAMNWVYKDVIEPFERKEREDILYARWRSIDNPSYPQEEYDRLKQILPPRIFRMRVEGIHEKAEGLIFEDWGEDNWVDPQNLSTSEIYGAIDPGFGHPMGVLVRAFQDNMQYTVSIFKKTGLAVGQQLDLIQSKTRVFGVKRWFCGHDRPEVIAELNKRGIPTVSWLDGNEDYKTVNAGNAKHAELIRSKRYKCFRGIEQWQDLEDEYQTYIWEKQEELERAKYEKPVNFNDDLMACERYLTVGTLRLQQIKVANPKDRMLSFVHRDTFKPGKKDKDSWDAW